LHTFLGPPISSNFWQCESLPQKLKFPTDVRFWHVVTSHYAALHAGGVTARRCGGGGGNAQLRDAPLCHPWKGEQRALIQMYKQSAGVKLAITNVQVKE
jgi:hypothetical protein